MGEINRELILDCLSKLDKITDDSWEEIIDRYELDYSDSHLRKVSYGFRAYRDCMTDNDTEEFIKLKKEKIKFQDIRTETNKQLRNLAKMETVNELLVNEINKLATKNPMINNTFNVKNTSSGKDGIFMLGDIHDYLIINNSLNQYNHEVCVERLNNVVDGVINKGLKENIDKLHIVGLGDYVSGEIHRSLTLSNQEEITTQIIGVSELLSQAIFKLSKYFYCTVTMTIGNHDSCEANKNDRLNKHNYTKLVREFVKIRVKDLSNVAFLDNTINDDEIGILKVKNLNCACCHGDKINKMKAKEQLEMATKLNLDLIMYGHYHNPQYYTLYNTHVYVNSSLCGSDEYAANHKLFSEYSQTMIIVSDDGIECSYLIK